MKIAMPVWENRLSPVLDSAGRLLVIEIADGREQSRNIYVIPPGDIHSRVRFISELGVDILICGAVSQLFEQRLKAAGIKISPWFRGCIDDIISAHTSGRLQSENFFMPGCRRGRADGRGRCCGGRGAGLGRRRYNQEDT